MKRSAGTRWDRKRAHQVKDVVRTNHGSNKWSKRFTAKKNRASEREQLHHTLLDDDWDVHVEGEDLGWWSRGGRRWLPPVTEEARKDERRSLCRRRSRTFPHIKPSEIHYLPDHVRPQYYEQLLDGGGYQWYYWERIPYRYPSKPKMLEALQFIYRKNRVQQFEGLVNAKRLEIRRQTFHWYDESGGSYASLHQDELPDYTKLEDWIYNLDHRTTGLRKKSFDIWTVAHLLTDIGFDVFTTT